MRSGEAAGSSAAAQRGPGSVAKQQVMIDEPTVALGLRSGQPKFTLGEPTKRFPGGIPEMAYIQPMQGSKQGGILTGPGFQRPAPYRPPQPRRPVMGPVGPINRRRQPPAWANRPPTMPSGAQLPNTWANRRQYPAAPNPLKRGPYGPNGEYLGPSERPDPRYISTGTIGQGSVPGLPGGGMVQAPGSILQRMMRGMRGRLPSELSPTTQGMMGGLSSALGVPEDDLWWSYRNALPQGVDPSQGMSASF